MQIIVNKRQFIKKNPRISSDISVVISPNKL